MLQEKALKLRRERAQQEEFQISRTGPDRLLSDYQVDSWSGRVYTVRIRSLDEIKNSCTCPDFQSNNLGTCKHIEAVLLWLADTQEGKKPRRPHRYAEVYLDYGETLRILIDLPADPSPELAAVAQEFFEGNVLREDAVHQFSEVVSRMERVPESVVIASEVFEHVDRLQELHEALADEARMLVQLERGDLELPSLKIPLYPYQQRGVLFTALRQRTILADDMGLGKTMQAIGAAMLLRERRGIASCLVVCPASLKHQWKREIERTCDATVAVIEGNRKARRELYRSDAFFKIVNYELLMRDDHEVGQLELDLVILDEAQRIKNWQTKTAVAVKRLRSRYAIVLTGTPLENRLEELYSVVQFVDNRLLGPMWRFEEEHVTYDDRGKAIGYQKLDTIRERLRPIMLRRTRNEVLRELPERTDQDYSVEMTPQQWAPYHGQSRIVAQILRKKYMTELDFQRLMCALQNMRMLCDSTYLYDQETNFSPKLQEFEELIKELVLDSGRKVVVFTQWERMQRKAAEVLDKLGISHVRLHGGVPTKRRGELIDSFTEDPTCSVFLSTDAGGVGLNLQAASAVINLDLPWNPAVLEQRIARVHRMGQRNPVQVINLIAESAIEGHIRDVIHQKKALFDGLLDGDLLEIKFPQNRRQQFVETIVEIVEEAPAEPTIEPEEDLWWTTDLAQEPEPAEPAPEPRPATEPAKHIQEAFSAFVDAGLQLAGAFLGGRGGQAAPAVAAALDSVRGTVAESLRYDPESNQVSVSFPAPSPEQLGQAVTALAQIFAPSGADTQEG